MRTPLLAAVLLGLTINPTAHASEASPPKAAAVDDAFETYRVGVCLGRDTTCWGVNGKVEYTHARFGLSVSGVYIPSEIINSTVSVKRYRARSSRWRGAGGLRTYFHAGIAWHVNNTDAMGPDQPGSEQFENGISPGFGFGADIHVGWDTMLVVQPQLSMVIMPTDGEDIEGIGTVSLAAMLAF